jgi:ATP-dependent phosphoenolpyruvate carboxykinase
MFRNRVENNHKVKVWLVNTGFDKNYKRFSLSQTRGVINGVIERDYEDDYIEYNELKIPKRIGKYNMEKVFEKPDNNRQDKFFTMLKDSL